MSWWRWTAVGACACALLLSACGLVREEQALATPSTPAPNAIMNGGFEFGPALWLGAGDLQVDTSNAKAGAVSLALGGDGPPAATQTIAPEEFPQMLSGFYYVDAWSGETEAHIEFSVTARGPAMAPETQRFFIAGADSEPPGVPPEQSVFLSRDDPKVGAWTYFAYPLWDAWVRERGEVPLDWAEIDVTFAVAGDERVLFDELYAGPQWGNPNRSAAIAPVD